MSYENRKYLREMGCKLRSIGNSAKYKPLIGGCWGGGRFLMASTLSSSSGLWEVTYFVVDAASGFPIAFSRRGKADALALAREGLVNLGDDLAAQCAQQEKDHAAHEAASVAYWEEIRQRNAEFDAAQARPRKLVDSIPRRRRKIFEESGGKCHYCSTPLTLDGKWHIEHKMPKALGGGNEPGNLVASCVPCNHKKCDTTDIEFKARLSREREAGGSAA
jgi:5-methylcytosine-specific restriction endonuclease McrA